MDTRPEELSPDSPPQKTPPDLIHAGLEHLKLGAIDLQETAGWLASRVSRSLQDRWQSDGLSAASDPEIVKKVGPLAAEGVFGTTAIEIYEGGYVRVAKSADGEADGKATRDTPYEKLISIEISEGGSSASDALHQSTATVASVMTAKLLSRRKGMVGSVGSGLAAMGVDRLVHQLGQKAVLTVATDRQVHSLTNQRRTYVGLMLPVSGHNALGTNLVAAGKRVLRATGTEVEPTRTETATLKARQRTIEPATLGEQIRELSALNVEGLLTDEEFTDAKRRLLQQL